MKYRYAFLLFLAAFFLQTTLLNVVSIFGVAPNLLLCLVIIFSFLYDEGYYGLVFGVLFGLLYDICFSKYMGIASIGFFIVALSIMLVNIVMNKDTILSVIVITVAATFAYQSIYWGTMVMLGSGYSYLHMLKLLPGYVLYNTVVTALLYHTLIRKVTKHHKDRYYK